MIWDFSTLLPVLSETPTHLIQAANLQLLLLRIYSLICNDKQMMPAIYTIRLRQGEVAAVYQAVLVVAVVY
jgi:hypothetical protein